MQPNGNPVQAELQQAVSIILRGPIVTARVGWADVGMHVREMSAHLDFHAEIDAKQFTHKLNHLLPRDISVLNVSSLSEGMHARFGAKWYTHYYYIRLSKNPFLRHYPRQLPYQLGLSLINETASHLLKVGDFGVFYKNNIDVKTTLYHVVQVEWVEVGGDAWYLVIKASRFLRNMARAMVGTLMEMGRHRMTLDEFDAIVRSGNRIKVDESTPTNALFLENVKY